MSSEKTEITKTIIKGLTQADRLKQIAQKSYVNIKDIINDGSKEFKDANETYKNSIEEFKEIKNEIKNSPVTVTEGTTFKDTIQDMSKNGGQIVADTAKDIAKESANIISDALKGLGRELSKILFNKDFFVYDKVATEYKVYANKLKKTSISGKFGTNEESVKKSKQFFEKDFKTQRIVQEQVLYRYAFDAKVLSDKVEYVFLGNVDSYDEETGTYHYKGGLRDALKEWTPPALSKFSVAHWFATNPASTRVPGKQDINNDKVFDNDAFMKGTRGAGISEYGTEYYATDHTKGDGTDIRVFGQNMKDLTARNILLSGADFLPHFFDIALYSYNDEGFDSIQKRDGNILDARGFAVRLGKISMTPSKNESFNLGAGERQIPKVRSSKTVSKTGTFSFRLDRYLLWLENFNQAAGVGNIFNDEKTYDPSKNFDTRMITRSYIGNYSNTHSKKVCLLCSKISLLGLRDTTIASVVELSGTSNMLSRETQNPREWGYIFEDVRFAGTQDAISYNSDTNGPQDITVTFTYKRVRKVFYDDTSSYWSLYFYGA